MKPAQALLVAWTIATLLFLYVPVAVLIGYSFNDSALNIVWQGFTTKWYVAIWNDRSLLHALSNSLVVAGASTALSVLLGTAAGYLLHRYAYPGGRMLQTLMLVPMIVPEVILGVSLLILFVAAGVELGFLTLVLSHVTFCFPFVMVAVQARLARIDPTLMEAALDLGATPSRAFRKVLLPDLMPAIVAGGLLSFSLSLDELIVSYFTASASSRTLPIEIFGRIRKGLDPTLNAISTVMIVTTAALVVAAELLRRRDSSGSVQTTREESAE
ncbi:MAG TPA: ABC transporter permease [Terriglobales bacterium]|nr:ABC transporter permease [Terriglobales bacterium]